MSTAFTEERRGDSQMSEGVAYIPTEDERRVFRECNQESLWYRSLPLTAVSMAVTQALIVKGTLTASPRFGSLPKVAIAGMFGYMAGKLSYMKTCQEKFMRLENSPLGEAMRQRARQSSQAPQGPQSELSDPDVQSFDSMFQAVDPQSQAPPQASDYGYATEPPAQTGLTDPNAPAPPYQEEVEEPRRRRILYEDLRNRNRENYEVTLTQKAETLPKPAQERLAHPEREAVKKNAYGDALDE